MWCGTLFPKVLHNIDTVVVVLTEELILKLIAGLKFGLERRRIHPALKGAR